MLKLRTVEILVYELLFSINSGDSIQLQVNCIWPKMIALYLLDLKKTEAKVTQKFII